MTLVCCHTCGTSTGTAPCSVTGCSCLHSFCGPHMQDHGRAHLSKALNAASVASPVFVAVDPHGGVVLRLASIDEVDAYRRVNAQRTGLRAGRAFDEPVRVGEVRVDLDTGPGGRMPEWD